MDRRFEGKMTLNSEAFYHMNYANLVLASTRRRRYGYILLVIVALYVGIHRTFLAGIDETYGDQVTLWLLVLVLIVGGYFYTKRHVVLNSATNKRLAQMSLSAQLGDVTDVTYGFYDDHLQAESAKGVVKEGYDKVQGLGVTPLYLLLFMGKNRVHAVRLDRIEGGETAAEKLKQFLSEKCGKPVEKIPMDGKRRGLFL